MASEAGQWTPVPRAAIPWAVTTATASVAVTIAGTVVGPLPGAAGFVAMALEDSVAATEGSGHDDFSRHGGS